ncbi:FAD-dependent oxidoreductase [Candidatus Parcubacteria bacterium]|nr:MAG: FAD-dependent oxidoreductase [Candidatus Parcubacteria bacterium]
MIKETSVWKDGILQPAFSALEDDLSFDVAVIGGGITGLTAAYILAKAGLEVCVLEKNKIASGESSLTTAFISFAADANLTELAARWGEKKSGAVWRSMQEAADKIEKIVIDEFIDCDFIRCPLFYYATDKKGQENLLREFEYMEKLGIKADLMAGVFNFDFSAIKIYNHAKFHPLKYLFTLAEKISLLGGKIFENTEIISYSNCPKFSVKTKKNTVKAKNIVIATHNPDNWAFDVHTRILPKQTYVIAGTSKKNLIPEGLYIDTQEPYHYFRLDSKSGRDIFFLGGEDHKTGKKQNKPYEKLEEYLDRLISKNDYNLTNKWSGQILETADGLPFVGRYIFNPKEFLTSTGYAGDGMTFGTLSAMINSDLILGKKNEYEKLYSIKRFKGVKKFMKQNVNYIKQMVAGRIKTKKEPAKLPFNSGTVINEDNKKIAVYKDKNGRVQKMSAVCTHLGCIVAWNGIDKTWDCPCHGSKFYKNGEVKNGPANKPLAPLR